MCGIVALIPNGSISKDMITIFKEALYVDALRGWDGTGIFKVDHQGKSDVYKIPSVPGNLFHQMENDKNYLWGVALVGHNRAATRGIKTKENTHPFKEGNITLVHNGTLPTHKHLADTDVDSHAICHYLNNNKPQDFVNNVFGAYAMIWHDARNNTINVLRNKERPLHVFNTPDFKFLCSEKDMGTWILRRNNIKISSQEEIKEDILHTLYLKDKEPKFVKADCKRVTAVVPFEPKKKLEKEERLWEEFFLGHLAEYYNIVTKDNIDVVLTLKTIGSGTGIHMYTGHLDVDKDYKVKVYTKETLPLGSIIELNFATLIQDTTGDKFVLLCTLPTKKEEKQLQLDRHGQPINFFTKDNVYINARINEELIGEECEVCHSLYNAHKDMVLDEVKMGTLHLRYKYTCHVCAAKLH